MRKLNRVVNNLPKLGDIKGISDEVAYNIITSDNPLHAYVKFTVVRKALEKVFKDKDVKQLVSEELEKQDSGYTVNGIEIKRKVSRHNYDFSKCNHPLYNRIVYLIDELEGYKKDIEEDLKALLKEARKTDVKAKIKSNNIVIEKLPSLVWEDYGEVTEVNPPDTKPLKSIYVYG